MKWLSGLLLFGMSSAIAQTASPISEVHTLFLQDQAGRGPTGNTGPSSLVADGDAQRLQRTRKLLQDGQITTGGDLHDAAFIFQHSLKQDDYLIAHVLATAAIAKGDQRSLWIAAASLDRYLRATGKAQLFGTQYGSRSFLYFAQHPVNPDLNSAEAKDTSITQQPYDSSVLSDSIRRTFCVVDLKTQANNVKALTAGHPLERTPAGCPEE